jgi:hypothetical protein
LGEGSDVSFVLCSPKDKILRFGSGDSACYFGGETEEIGETYAIDIVPITEWVEQESMQTCRPCAENIDIIHVTDVERTFWIRTRHMKCVVKQPWIRFFEAHLIRINNRSKVVSNPEPCKTIFNSTIRVTDDYELKSFFPEDLKGVTYTR